MAKTSGGIRGGAVQNLPVELDLVFLLEEHGLEI